MVVQNIDDFNSSMVKKIEKLYFDNYTPVKDIIQKYNRFSRTDILAILKSLGATDQELKSNICSVNIEALEFIVIGDTHICSKYENLDYLNIVYDFALENGIKHVFHTGDIIEGNTSFKGDYPLIIDQAEYLVDKYPKTDITTHMLLGNHDFNATMEDDNYLKILKSRKDFDVLSFKKCYFSVYNYLFSLTHEIKNYKLQIPNFETIIGFAGHRHELKCVGPQTVFTPTLSNDIKYYGKDNKPGFILCIIEGNQIYAYHFTIKKEKINYEEKIVSRKLEKKFRK